jgi:heme o synthase
MVACAAREHEGHDRAPGMEMDTEPAATAKPARGRAVSPDISGASVSRHLMQYAKLVKLPIAAFSALSGVTGFVVFRRAPDPGVFTVFAGIMALAMGACALNEFQDRKLDARMDRTRRRPIPNGAITPAEAVAIALLLLVAGFMILWIAHRPAAAWIGLGAVAWYNGMYTYLKRVWAFAVAPGALVGALPPVLGWTAAGGRPLDAHIIALAFFFFIWQVPHFWLLLFKFGEDYEKAGLPSLTRIFSLRQLASLTFIWMLATSASSLLLPVYSLAASHWAGLGFVLAAIWLAWEAARVKGSYLRTGSLLPAFRSINIYALLVIGLLVGDALS